jgi:hypothetical protein
MRLFASAPPKYPAQTSAIVVHQGQKAKPGSVGPGIGRIGLDAGDQQFTGIARRQFRKQSLETPCGLQADRVADPDFEAIALERAFDDDVTRFPELDGIFQKLVDQIADAVARFGIGLL